MLGQEPLDPIVPAPSTRLADDAERRPANVAEGHRAVAGMRSCPDEIWVLGFEPVAAPPAPMEAARPLRHDPFEAKFAGLGEHDRAFFGERLVEQDSVGAPPGDQPSERLSPLLKRALPQIVAAETQKVEGHQRGLLPAVFGEERMEVAPPSSRNTTASPSIIASSALTPRTASAILEKRPVKSAPRRLQTVTRLPCFQATMRKPSCLISCSQPGPAGGRSTSVGSHGWMNPGGALRRQSEGVARQDTFFKPDLFVSWSARIPAAWP
jgi:hypothetical protein